MSFRSPVLALTASLALSVTLSCSRASRGVDEPLQFEPLTSPAGGQDTSEPELSVSGDRIVMSWIEQPELTATLKFAEWTSNGWSEARTVSSGDTWFLSGADIPSVMRLSDGTLAAHWLESTDESIEAYDIRIAFSKDDGRSWAPAVAPHHDGTTTQHGFVSLFEMPGAGLGLIWLDGRTIELEADKSNDNMSLRAATFDPTGKQVSETLVDERVCECCSTSVALTSQGPIAAFRDRSSEEIRDIYVSRFVDGRWTASKSVHDDQWLFLACPVNGPVISARNQQVAVAWFTAKDDSGRAFAAFSSDGGQTFGQPIRLDDGESLGHVDIDLLEDGSAVATWIEFADRQSDVRVRRVNGSGQRGPAHTLAGLGDSRGTGFPRLARRGNELIAAWTAIRDGRTEVRTAIAKLP